MKIREIIVEYRNNRIENWDNLDPRHLIKAVVDSTHDGRHLTAWIDAVKNVWRGEGNQYTQNFLTAYNTIKHSIDPAERRRYAEVLSYAHANRVNSDVLRKFKPSLFNLPPARRTQQPTPTIDDSDSELMRNLSRRQRMAQALYGTDSGEDEPQRKSSAERILKWLPSTVYATVLAIMNDPQRAVEYLKMPWTDISSRAQRGDPYAALLLVANRVRQGNISTDKDVDIPGGAKKRSIDA